MQGGESGSQKKMAVFQSTACPVLKDNCSLLSMSSALQGLILPRIKSDSELPPRLSQSEEDRHTGWTQRHQAPTLVLTSLTGQVRHRSFFSKCSFCMFVSFSCCPPTSAAFVMKIPFWMSLFCGLKSAFKHFIGSLQQAYEASTWMTTDRCCLLQF